MVTEVGLDALFAAVDEMSAHHGSSRVGLLLEHGLSVHDTRERWSYASTPENSVTFASTGGDGVHFGLLRITSASADDNGPVVMTVPSASSANHIIAESVGEFLELGGARGWFSLEQLAYRPEYAFERYADTTATTHPLIAELFTTLSLKPRALKPKRLKELSRRYAASLVLTPKDPTAESKPLDLEAFLAWKRSKYSS